MFSFFQTLLTSINANRSFLQFTHFLRKSAFRKVICPRKMRNSLKLQDDEKWMIIWRIIGVSAPIGYADWNAVKRRKAFAIWMMMFFRQPIPARIFFQSQKILFRAALQLHFPALSQRLPPIREQKQQNLVVR